MVKNLGQLETAVMERLWARSEPAAVRDVLEDLQRERPLAYTTVMTVLDNLHGKGLVRREKQGRAYLYAAAMSHEDYTAQLMEQALTHAGDRGAALLRFVGQLSPEEISELRLALESATEDER